MQSEQVDAGNARFARPTAKRFRKYQLHLIRPNASRAQLVQFVAAARFLYLKTLEKDGTIKGIPSSRLPKRLPSVLTEAEVQTLLKSVIKLKHRSIMMTMYSEALRVSEACNLLENIQRPKTPLCADHIR